MIQTDVVHRSVRDDLDETTLVARAQDGDLDAFEKIVDLYSGPLFRLTLRMLGDRNEAEDVVQETMITVWRRVPQLVDSIAFPKWVYQIATRLALNVLRTRRRRPGDAIDPDDLNGLGAHDPSWTSGSPGIDPASTSEQRALAAALEEQIRLLPDDQRVCWVLHAYHRCTYAEIAQIVSAGEPTVRGRIARARRRLAEGMAAWR